MLKKIKLAVFLWPKVKDAYQRLRNPLARKLWWVSVFKFHQWFTPKLWFHCLVNFHQFGSIIHKANGQTLFMIQHFCATCRPDVLARMTEMAKRAQESNAQAKTETPKE